MKSSNLKVLAEILGLLCAEGCHVVSCCSYYGKDGAKIRYFKNKRAERIEFYNKDVNLLLHYQNLLNIAFCYSAKITKHGKINVCKRDLVRNLISYTELGTKKWAVPDFVKSGSANVKIAFIRGYFDGDGTASNRIRFFSINNRSLLQVFELLRSLDFDPTFQGPIIKKGRQPAYIIQIRQKEGERFLSMIKPISKRPS